MSEPGPAPAASPVEGLVDAHVHLFPPGVFEAIWRWFDKNAWNVAYRLHAEEVVEFLVERGVRHMVALHYSHVPDMARELNRFVADVARRHPEVLPLGTVYPGEPDAAAVLREALGTTLGLRGLKLHCHVQRVSPNDPRLDEIYRHASDAGLPVVLHAGNAPALPGYGIDPRALCDAEATRDVLRRFPRLKLVVPHLGYDETSAYFAMLDEFENLWLDTTMTLAGHFAPPPDASLLAAHADRILFGTDFPNLPYAWDSEIAWLSRQGLDAEILAKLTRTNALGLFGGP